MARSDNQSLRRGWDEKPAPNAFSPGGGLHFDLPQPEIGGDGTMLVNEIVPKDFFVTRQDSFVWPTPGQSVFSELVRLLGGDGHGSADWSPAITDGRNRTDVTPTSEPAEDLRTHFAQLAQRLSESNSDMEAMCSAIAAGLQSPLRDLRNLSLQFDQGQRTRPEGGKDFAQHVSLELERLHCLAEGLLNYGKLSQEEPICESVSLDPVILAVTAQLAQSIAAKSARVQIQSPLPEVRAHASLLQEVLAHLIDNALKFVSPGVVPQVWIRSEVRGTRIRITVEDNGIGIPSEHHELIFGLFQRLSDAYPGSGSGLALVRKGVERMGGEVGVESAPGKGSRFWIELPKD